MPDAQDVITHSVVDVDNWLRFKAERAEAIGGLGGTNVVDHLAHDAATQLPCRLTWPMSTE